MGAEPAGRIVYTASGAEAVQGVTIAADWSIYPPGTVLFVEGLGEMVVQDRGGAIQGQKIDVYFESHDDAPSVRPPECPVLHSERLKEAEIK